MSASSSPPAAAATPDAWTLSPERIRELKEEGRVLREKTAKMFAEMHRLDESDLRARCR